MFECIAVQIFIFGRKLLNMNDCMKLIIICLTGHLYTNNWWLPAESFHRISSWSVLTCKERMGCGVKLSGRWIRWIKWLKKSVYCVLRLLDYIKYSIWNFCCLNLICLQSCSMKRVSSPARRQWPYNTGQFIQWNHSIKLNSWSFRTLTHLR